MVVTRFGRPSCRALALRSRWAPPVMALVAISMIIGGCSQPANDAGEISVEGAAASEPVAEAVFGPDDWPWWRGSNRNGIAQGPPVPTTWSETENVIWKTPLSGRGHSSPTVVADSIYLATADDDAQVQSVICLNRNDGHQRWKTDIHTGGFPGADGVHRENTNASCTLACDGERVFVAFLNGGHIWATALDLAGEQVWQQDIGSFTPDFGYAPSPLIYKSLVIFAADNKGGGYLAALHRGTGNFGWRKPRKANSSYSSPALYTLDGKDQLLISGCDLVASYDPNTGDELWSVKGTTEATCGTMVASPGENVVFASGGYPGSETLCVRADGSGEVLWRNRLKAYVPSMMLFENHLYLIDGERGIGSCLDAKTGTQTWQARFGRKVRSSPVLSGEHIYWPNADGTTHVFRASPTRFERVAENQLGDETYATPTICGGRLYLRVADSSSGTRQETLYCIGNRDSEPDSVTIREPAAIQ